MKWSCHLKTLNKICFKWCRCGITSVETLHFPGAVYYDAALFPIQKHLLKNSVIYRLWNVSSMGAFEDLCKCIPVMYTSRLWLEKVFLWKFPCKKKTNSLINRTKTKVQWGKLYSQILTISVPFFFVKSPQGDLWNINVFVKPPQGDLWNINVAVLPLSHVA